MDFVIIIALLVIIALLIVIVTLLQQLTHLSRMQAPSDCPTTANGQCVSRVALGHHEHVQDRNYSVYTFRQGSWVLQECFVPQGSTPGGPPDRPGDFEGQTIRLVGRCVP